MKNILDRRMENTKKEKKVAKTFVSLWGKCPQCDVTSYSSAGLKGHITKTNKETGVKFRGEVNARESEIFPATKADLLNYSRPTHPIISFYC